MVNVDRYESSGKRIERQDVERRHIERLKAARKDRIDVISDQAVSKQTPTNQTLSNQALSKQTCWNPPLAGETELQLQLDRVTQELLQARDALIGAESEAGVLRAKLTEVEAQLRANDRELGELAAMLLASEAQVVEERASQNLAGENQASSSDNALAPGPAFKPVARRLWLAADKLPSAVAKLPALIEKFPTPNRARR